MDDFYTYIYIYIYICKNIFIYMVDCPRAKFIEEFTLRSMRLKQEKWAKLVGFKN